MGVLRGLHAIEDCIPSVTNILGGEVLLSLRPCSVLLKHKVGLPEKISLHCGRCKEDRGG